MTRLWPSLIAIKRARTWHYGKMRHCIGQFNALAISSPFQSWLDCITNTSGYHFRRAQVICGEMHLRRILSAYAAYYNQARTHLALGKNAPLHRAVQRSGAIVAIPILAGLHHQYVRI
jgi:hypothetical protein